MKRMIFGFSLAFCLMLCSSVVATEQAVTLSGQQLTALILVSEHMKKNNLSLENRSFHVEDHGATLAIRVSEIPPTDMGGVFDYLVSKSEKKIISVKGEK